MSFKSVHLIAERALPLLVLSLLPPPAFAQQQEAAKEVSAENLNFPTATLGGTQFWSDELVFHRWRIQLRVVL